MRDALRGKWYAQRIENIAGLGTPDVMWASRPASGVFELKVARGDRVRFRPGQIPWMLQWVEQGGRGHIVVWHKGVLRVFLGEYVVQLHEQGISRTPQILDGTEDWDDVLRWLKNSPHVEHPGCGYRELA